MPDLFQRWHLGRGPFLQVNKQTEITAAQLPPDLLHQTGFAHAPLGDEENVRTVIKLADQQFDILFPIPETVPFHVITICLFQFFLHDNPPIHKNNSVGNNYVGNNTTRNSRCQALPTKLFAKRKGTTASWFNNANFFRVQGQAQNAGFVDTNDPNYEWQTPLCRRAGRLPNGKSADK
ncbi:MAG: hypothetical protein ACOY4W_20300 [Thermodesulfobacteriota bacterium]